MMDSDEMNWVISWARVLQKVKNGAQQDGPTELTRRDCQTMIRGLRMISGKEDEGAN